MISKRLLFFAAVLIPISFLSGERPNGWSANLTHRQRAIEMNDLAAKIQSPDDARKLVEMVATELSDESPSRWVTRKMRTRIAQAEYESATNPERLIPEQRVADAWNHFVREIGAEADLEVTAAEVHYLRDANYTTERMSWAGWNQTIFAMPNIYPVGPHGKVAEGCRALDALHTIWNLSLNPDTIAGAREMVRKGFVLSDETERERKTPHRSEYSVSVFQVAGPSPIEIARDRYVKEHGRSALRHAVENLIDDLFPE